MNPQEKAAKEGILIRLRAGRAKPNSHTEAEENQNTEIDPNIAEMNQRYFVAQTGGRGVIASFVRDDQLDRERLVFSREQDIRLLYRNRHVVVGFTRKGTEIRKDLGAAWLEHPDRRTFDRIALIPKGSVPPGVLNLWRGFGVKRAGGDWSIFRKHLLDVVCNGNQGYYDYLVQWCAYCVQHPEKQAEVAVVLRGLKGTGKGTVGKVMARIFRDHSLHITHARHLTGNFNAHLVDTLFLFLDEAFWGGDKQGEGVLKAIITEDSIMIEPKGQDPFMMPNRLKILMSSNNEWVVPASADERRYFVLDVNDKHRNDRLYFNKLHKALEDGERAAFLDHLLTLKLENFDVRTVPHTEGLNRQKLISADSVTTFWHDCLREGSISDADRGEWPKTIVTRQLHTAYVEHANKHGERRVAIDARMSERLRELWAGCNVHRIRPYDPYGGSDRPWRYQLDTLENHRAAFLKAMNIETHEWPEAKNDGA